MDENTTHKTIALRPKKERASHHKQQRQPRQQCWDVVVAWVHCWWCGPLQPRQTTCNGNNATKNKGQEGGGGGGKVCLCGCGCGCFCSPILELTLDGFFVGSGFWFCCVFVLHLSAVTRASAVVLWDPALCGKEQARTHHDHH